MILDSDNDVKEQVDFEASLRTSYDKQVPKLIATFVGWTFEASIKPINTNIVPYLYKLNVPGDLSYEEGYKYVTEWIYRVKRNYQIKLLYI